MHQKSALATLGAAVDEINTWWESAIL